MTVTTCPKSLIFVNALFALTAISLISYQTPTNFLNRQAFLLDNNFLNKTPVQEQLHNQPTSDKMAQCIDSRQGGGGWGHGRYGRMYNVKTVETIKGKVVSVDRIYPKTRNVSRCTFTGGNTKRYSSRSFRTSLVY